MSQHRFSRQLRQALAMWWQEPSRKRGTARTTILLAGELWSFLRDSTPERRRSRYGDMEYDWEHHVNTSSGTVGWRARLLGIFHSPYQPTDPVVFREMMARLPIDFSEFTFVDLGSGKGRTLLMASEYPFRRIVGVEILPELHRVAEENIQAYKSDTQRCGQIESVCADASEFVLPQEPLVLYLFNPLPAQGLAIVLQNLGESIDQNPRNAIIIYHNPVLADRLQTLSWLTPVSSTNEFVVYKAKKPG